MLLSYGNDTNIVYQYDLGDRLTRITNNLNASSIDIQYNNYDNVGNRLNMIVNGSETDYLYDKLYQLVFVDYAAGQGTDANYYYDALGNRTKVIAGTTSNYTHNKLNQYTAVDANTYSYDSKGNLINDGTYKYYYDYENRLTDVNLVAGTKVARYTYDYLGRRISKIIGATTTKYCYDGDQIIADYNSGTLIRKFVYGPSIDEPVCMIVVNGGETRYYYHYNGLGSVVALSNSSGTVVENYNYNAFGVPSGPNSVGNPYLFTGRQYDSETGLYYYRARYYKPSIGRFLQPDPIRYKGGLNLYAYCINNSINFIDPYGLDVWIQNDFIHQGIAVGNPNGTYTRWDFGWIFPFPFMGEVEPTVVTDEPGNFNDSERIVTTKEMDDKINKVMEKVFTDKIFWCNVFMQNCRTFSHDMFKIIRDEILNDDIKENSDKNSDNKNEKKK